MAKSYTFQDVADALGITPKRARALHRSYVKSRGGTIGQDTPGKGKRYVLNAQAFAEIKKHVTARAAIEKSESSKDAPAESAAPASE